jgi:hypothetical protein
MEQQINGISSYTVASVYIHNPIQRSDHMEQAHKMGHVLTYASMSQNKKIIK